MKQSWPKAPVIQETVHIVCHADIQDRFLCAGRSSRDEPKAAGLGYTSSPPRSQGGEADPYDSYRRQRADTYHELLARDRTREEAPSTAGRRRKSRFDV